MTVIDMKVKCKRCSGTGEAFGGTCYSCNGAGEVPNVRYQTVPASESKVPGMVADREEVPRKHEWSPRHIAEPELEACKAICEGAETETFGKPRAEPVNQLTCEHEFRAFHYVAMCAHCNIFQHQYFHSIAALLPDHTLSEAAHDPAGQVGATASSTQIPSIQGRSGITQSQTAGIGRNSDIPDANAQIVVEKEAYSDEW